jgi:hypothetical protein
MSSKDAQDLDPLAGAALPDTADLTGLSLRDLLRELARLEDELHDLRRTVADRSDPIPDPQHRLLLMLERAVILELRSRRSGLKATQPVGVSSQRPSESGRRHSAAWPPPPWS